MGPKQATSRGCNKWVELAGKALKLMPLAKHKSITGSEKWEDKLSPMMSFLADGSSSAHGKTTALNQRSNCAFLNQPEDEAS